jgi:hypothetical protein
LSVSETYLILENVFGKGNVISEWDVSKKSQDALQKGLQYCPRIDFVIKPLNIDTNVDRNQNLIHKTYYAYEIFFEKLKKIGLNNRYWRINNNPRCFLAIEYENKNTTKHRVGSLINACALGNVGIIVALNDKTFQSYERIVKYLAFLHVNNKLPVHPNNYIILKQDDFENQLRNSVGYHRFIQPPVDRKKIGKLRVFTGKVVE